jgi:nicotinamide mononucleotide (NMN) deamidase PncC
MPPTENVEVARQMTQGALERSPASIAVSVTGVLGPESDEEQDPRIFQGTFAARIRGTSSSCYT